MRTGDGVERNGGAPDPGPPDEELTPELRRAVAVLRRLPPASPGAVARVVAAAAADRQASRARTRAARRWGVGALAAAAAGIALVIAGERGKRPVTSRLAADTPADTTRSAPRVTDAGVRGTVRGAQGAVVRAVGSASDPASGDAPQPVTFVLRRPGARAVAVVGDFNQWDARATPLARGADGGWSVPVPLTPGRHAYRFVVDDTLRVLDPRAPAERDADLGVARSVVVVGAP